MSDNNGKPQDLIKIDEARKLLDVSRPKIARLIKTNELRHFLSPLDNRVKLVSKAEVMALLNNSGKSLVA